jgi:phage/plasmid-associated DNA primase
VGVKNLPYNERNPKYEAKFVNMFAGFKAKLVEQVNEELIQSHLYHIKNLYCSGIEEQYKYLIHWLAHIVQFPEIKAGTSVVLQSEQGAGKNIFFNWFCRFILGHSVSLENCQFEKLIQQFNSTLEGKIFFVVNEICSKDRRIDHFEKMKSLITDPTQQIERKGFEPITFDNYSRFIFCSNSEKPIHIDQDDRRYFILKFGKKEPQYYTDYSKTLTEESANHFFTYLMNLDLSDFDIRRIPESQGREDIKELSLCKEEMFIRSNYWNDWIDFSIVYQKYKFWCQENHFVIANKTWFGRNTIKYYEKKKEGAKTMIKRKDLGENRQEMEKIEPNFYNL